MGMGIEESAVPSTLISAGKVLRVIARAAASTEHKARRSGKKTREGVPFARLVGVGVRDELIVELAYGAGQNFMLHSIPP